MGIKWKKGLIKWDVVHRNSLDFNAKKHLRFTTFLTSALLGSVPIANGSIPSQETSPYLPQMLLLKIQKKLISKKFDTRWIHLFSMSLFNTKDLINYIPTYIKYRIYYIANLIAATVDQPKSFVEIRIIKGGYTTKELKIPYRLEYKREEMVKIEPKKILLKNNNVP